MSTYQILNATNKHTINYRFTCEHCGITTKWFTVTIERFAAQTSERNMQFSVPQKFHHGEMLNAQASQKIQKQIDWIKEQIKNGVYPSSHKLTKDERNLQELNPPESENIFKKQKCPECKHYQSWAFSDMEKNAFVFIGCLSWLVLPAVTFGLIGLLRNKGILDLNPFWSILMAVGSIGLGFYLSLQVQRMKLDKIKRDSQSIKNKQIPEIDWNGR